MKHMGGVRRAYRTVREARRKETTWEV